MNNTPILKEAFLRGTKILDELNIPYILCGGTLLGLYREGQLLGHDGDVDVDVLFENVGYPEEFLKKLESKVSPQQGKVTYRPNYFTITYEDIAENEVKFDIFVLFKSKDTRYRHFPSDTDGGIYLTWSNSHYQNQEEIEFEGKKYKIPGDTEGWLVTFFGEDWKVPKPVWNWIQDSKNKKTYEEFISEIHK